MEINERFAHIRLSVGLNKKRFADSLGINQSVAGDIELGKREPSREVMLRLVTIYQVNINWLLTGEGTPFIKQSIGANTEFSPPGNELESIKNIAEPGLLTVPQKSVKIPLLKQKVSCGPGVVWETEENIEEYIEVDMFIPNLGLGRVFAVKAQGSSMLGASIHDGDYVFFDSSEGLSPRDGIYVFALDGEVYCKRLEFDNLARKIKIFSVRVADLEKAELITSIDTKETEFADRFRIFGRVTRCIRLINIEG